MLYICDQHKKTYHSNLKSSILKKYLRIPNSKLRKIISIWDYSFLIENSYRLDEPDILYIKIRINVISYDYCIKIRITFLQNIKIT